MAKKTHHAKKHPAKAKSCKITSIKFKTKRGRKVEFTGRSAGTTKHGGDCKPKAATAAQKKVHKEMKVAAKICKRRTSSRGQRWNQSAYNHCTGVEIKRQEAGKSAYAG